MTRERKFVFGPVLSRRLGRSLGVDPVPLKTCTYDCVYCQLGRTKEKTSSRGAYVSPSEITKELEQVLREVEADYITISGSGEPTLNSRIGELISEIKKTTGTPVCVITNSSTLSSEEVRKQLLKADLVVPSLDAGDSETFRKINRPDESVDFESMAEGLVKFAEAFKGSLWLEIMIVEGINDSDDAVRKFIPLIERINPDRIQINTVVRPPAYGDIKGAGKEKLRRIKELLGEKAEIIAPSVSDGHKISGPVEEVLKIIQRRPSSPADVAAYAGMNINEAIKHLTRLEKENAVKSEIISGEVYYKPAENREKD